MNEMKCVVQKKKTVQQKKKQKTQVTQVAESYAAVAVFFFLIPRRLSDG